MSCRSAIRRHRSSHSSHSSSSFFLSQAAEKEIRNEINKAADEALAADPTPMEQLTKDIYVEDIKNVRGCDPFTFH